MLRYKVPTLKKKVFLNLNQKYQKQLPMSGVFDLHLPFFIPKCSFVKKVALLLRQKALFHE